MKYIRNPKVKLVDEVTQLYPNTSQIDYAVQSSIAYNESKRDFINYNKRSERAGLNRGLTTTPLLTPGICKNSWCVN